MEPDSLPSTELLENAEAVVAVCGEVNLFDAEVRAVRLGLAPGDDPWLEIDFHLPGSWAVHIEKAGRAAYYALTFRYVGVEDLVLAEFRYQNVVGDYGFEAATLDRGGPGVHAWLGGTPGCEFDLKCRSARVVSIGPVAEPPAA